jgi:hypothetical protein
MNSSSDATIWFSTLTYILISIYCGFGINIGRWLLILSEYEFFGVVTILVVAPAFLVFASEIETLGIRFTQPTNVTSERLD